MYTTNINKFEKNHITGSEYLQIFDYFHDECMVRTHLPMLNDDSDDTIVIEIGTSRLMILNFNISNF